MFISNDFPHHHKSFELYNNAFNLLLYSHYKKSTLDKNEYDITRPVRCTDTQSQKNASFLDVTTNTIQDRDSLIS